MKNTISKYFKIFLYFQSYLKYRVFIGLLLSVLVGVLDGCGIAMFLPLLGMMGGQNVGSNESISHLQFIIDFLNYFNLELSLEVVLLFISILFLLKGIVKFFEGYYSIIIQQSFIVSIRKQCIDGLTNLNYNSFVNSDVGRIQNTLSGEVPRLAGAYRAYFLTLQSITFVFVYIFLAFLSNPQFTALVVFGGLLSNIIFKRIYKKTVKLSSSVTNFGHQYQGLLIQSIMFFKYLKSTGRMKRYSSKIEKSVEGIENDNLKLGYIQSLIVAIREPIILLIVIGVIILQVNILGKELALIILSLLFFYRALNFLLVFQSQWNSFLSMSGSIENMTNFLTELNTNSEKYGPFKFNHLRLGIEFKNLYFSYNNEPTLKNINLLVKKNQTIAFVGESGSGKSTLVNILSGLLPINQGTFTIDGIKSEEIDMRTFQNRIGYITQEPVIFDDNIFNNVTFWDKKTPENESRFWEALRKSSIIDFVLDLPLKELAPLGNNGVLVSGGQKQRLSIARELYREIDVLIMDEATSALDSETEKVIQENIEQLKGKYTILIVAHRLSTIKNANEIVLMNKGEIVAKDTFQNLLSTNEQFQRMVSLQEL